MVGVPAKFIGTYGSLLTSGSNAGQIDPATKVDFKGHLGTGNLVIDGFEPGSTDNGNTAGQVVVIKPNSVWANLICSAIATALARTATTTASSATPTPNIDTTNQYALTALAANATFGAPTGTPTTGRGSLFE